MLNDYVLELCAQHDWHTSAASPAELATAEQMILVLWRACDFDQEEGATVWASDSDAVLICGDYYLELFRDVEEDLLWDILGFNYEAKRRTTDGQFVSLAKGRTSVGWGLDSLDRVAQDLVELVDATA